MNPFDVGYSLSVVKRHGRSDIVDWTDRVSSAIPKHFRHHVSNHRPIVVKFAAYKKVIDKEDRRHEEHHFHDTYVYLKEIIIGAQLSFR